MVWVGQPARPHFASPRGYAMNAVVALFGRLMMSAIFLQSGIMKAMAPDATLATFAKLAIPNPPLAYGVTVGVEILGGITVLVGFKTRWAALLLAGWCIATAVAVHYHPADRGQMVHLMKNICMAGGFLQLFALGGGRFSLDRR